MHGVDGVKMAVIWCHWRWAEGKQGLGLGYWRKFRLRRTRDARKAPGRGQTLTSFAAPPQWTFSDLGDTFGVSILMGPSVAAGEGSECVTQG